METAVGYFRCSTPRQQDQSKSIDQQRAEYRDYCKSKQYQSAGEFDDVISGARLDRRGFYELLARLEEGGIQVLVAWDTKRLGRNTFDKALLLTRCKEMGIRLETPGGGDYDFEDPYDVLMFNVMSSFDEFERTKTAIDCMRGKNHCVKRGNFASGMAPFGYRIEGKQGQKVLVPSSHADILREAYRRFLAGESQRSLARWLREVTDRKWHNAQVKYVLSNPVYVGWLRWDDKLVRGKHEPLIETTTWDAAQRRLDDAPILAE